MNSKYFSCQKFLIKKCVEMKILKNDKKKNTFILMKDFKYNILLCVKMNIVKKTSKMDAIVNIHHIIGHYFHVNDKVKESLLNRSKLLSVHISNSSPE